MRSRSPGPGRAGIEAARRRWPDVVLLDLGLPACDGYEVAKRIREQVGTRKKPLLVAVTGYRTDADGLRSDVEGLDLHFTKPVNPELLCGLLREFAATRQPG